VAGYLSPLGPAARAVEEPIARGAAAVPLTGINFSFVPGPDVDTEASVLQSVPVELHYSYKGLPEGNFFTIGFRYDIERQGRSWVVTRSQPDPQSLPIWATGPVQITSSQHFLTLFRPGLAHTSDASALAEQADAALAAQLPVVSDSIHLLLLARDHGQFEDFVGHSTPQGTVALTTFIYEGVTFPRARAMTVDMDALFGAGASGLVRLHQVEDVTPREVFQHELGHLALARYFSPLIPGWVNEGAAMYLSGERRTLAWRDGVAAHTFDALSFVDLSQSRTLDTADGYAYANAAVLYLVQTFGRDRFWRFFGDYGLTEDSAASGLLKRDYGFDAAELDTRTRAWIQTAAQGP
jgi:hypothetical protein